MKHIFWFAIAGTCLGGVPAILAQNSRAPILTQPFKGKLPRVTPTPPIKGQPTGRRIGERFHLRVWAEVLPAMPTRTWCGTLKIDDQLRWQIPPTEAANYSRGPGQTLEISEDATHTKGGSFTLGSFYSNPRKMKLRFDLLSVENGQTTTRAIYMDSVDLLKEKGKTYKCSMGKGEVALYVKPESIGYIYSPIIIRPLPTPTPRSSFGHPPPHHP